MKRIKNSVPVNVPSGEGPGETYRIRPISHLGEEIIEAGSALVYHLRLVATARDGRNWCDQSDRPSIFAMPRSVLPPCTQIGPWLVSSSCIVPSSNLSAQQRDSFKIS